MPRNREIIGNDQAETLKGGGGNDTIFAAGGDDRLQGRNGDDVLDGGTGSDRMLGGNDNDTLIWNNGDGSDIHRGGAGTDTTVVNDDSDQGDHFTLTQRGNKALFKRTNLVPFTLDTQSMESFEVNASGGDDQFLIRDLSNTTVERIKFSGGEGQDQLDGSETAVALVADGGSGDDLMQGSSVSDRFRGNQDNDTLLGGDGDDTLLGGEGDDIIAGQRGTDRMIGGSGDDTLIWNNGDGSDIHLGGKGFDTTVVNDDPSNADAFVLSQEGQNAVFNRINLVPFSLNTKGVERFEVRATGGDDELIIEDLSNTAAEVIIFSGGDGNDLMDGSETNVRIVANGEAGNDELLGGAGDDILSGGAGRNIISGGAGDDLLVVADGGDVLNGAIINELFGGEGNDFIAGGNSNDLLVGTERGTGEIDRLTGGAGNDIFQLSNEAGTFTFYDDGDDNTVGIEDFAIIADFSKANDTIVLDGAASDYFLGDTPGGVRVPGTGLFKDSNANGAFDNKDELIAVIQGDRNLNLSDGSFTFI